MRQLPAAGLLLWLAAVACPVAGEPGREFPELLNAARQAAQGNDTQAVNDAYAEAREAAPDETWRARCWYEEGCYWDAHGLRPRAVAAFEQVASSTESGPVLLASLERLARLYQRTGEVRKALAIHDRIIALCADEPPVVEQSLMAQVRLWRQAGDSARAAATARKLLELAPEGLLASEATNVLADIALQAGDWAEARRLALAESERVGGDTGMLLRVGLALRQAGRTADALALVESFAATHPDDDSALQTLFEMHQQAGSLDAYLKALQAASSQPDTRPSALRRLADLYTRRQEHAQALATLEELLKLVPETSDLQARAGYVATAARKLDAARAHLARALELEPDSTRLQSDLGDVYARQGQMEQAVALWKLAAGYDPANLASARLVARRMLSRGYAHLALQALEEALAVWRLRNGRPGEEGGPPDLAQGNPLAAEMGQAYEAELELEKATDCYLTALRQTADDPLAAAQADQRLRALLADGVAGPVALVALEKAVATGEVPDAALAALAGARLNRGDAAGANEALLRISDPARRAAQIMQLGDELMASGRPGGAAALYRVALETPPAGSVPLTPEAGARLSLRLARLQRDAGRWRAALEALGAAPVQPQPDTLLAWVLRLAEADLRVADASDPDTARPLYEQAQAMAPRPDLVAWARWGLADCAFAAGEYEDAAARYRALAEEAAEAGAEVVIAGPFGGYVDSPSPDFPGNPRGADHAALRLAEITFRGGDLAAARAQFLQVAHTWSAADSANDALARVLLIDTALGADSPGRSRYLQALGLLDRGDLEGALQRLDMIASTGPEDPLSAEAALLAARAFSRLGDPVGGRQRFEDLAAEFPDSPVAPAALLEAARLAAETDTPAAQALCQALTTRYPASPEASLAGELLEDLGRG